MHLLSTFSTTGKQTGTLRISENITFTNDDVMNYVIGAHRYVHTYLFESSDLCEHAKGNMQKTGKIQVRKTEESNDM